MSAETPYAVASPGLVGHHSTRRLIGLLLASTFVVILNETILIGALPQLVHDLDLTPTSAQWLTSGFLLTMAVVIPASGFLLTRFGTRAVFLGAISTFCLGTLLAATSVGFPILLMARVVQACGTALLIPLLTTTIITVVPESRRGRTMGTVSIVIGVAPAIGPTVSGLILSQLDWRWLFFLTVPLGLLALALGLRYMSDVLPRRPMSIDPFSPVLSALAFGSLVLGLSSVGDHAAALPVPAWVLAGGGLLLLLAFVARQVKLQQEDRAFLDLRTFQSRSFVLALIVMAGCMVNLLGTLIVLPLYFQSERGLDVLTTGLLLLPGGFMMGGLAPFIGRLYDRYGPRPLVPVGAATSGAGLLGLSFAATDSAPLAAVVLLHVVLSVGISMMLSPLFATALGALTDNLHAHGSAVVGTAQQLAGAAGIALYITILSSRVDADGRPDLVAGISSAFLCGACLAGLILVASLFVRSSGSGAVDLQVH